MKINHPYNGAIIPSNYSDENETLKSIMIEVNKRVYLDNNRELNYEKYNKLKECMDELFEKLEEKMK